MGRSAVRLFAAAALAAAAALPAAASATPPATPRAHCDAASHPAPGMQGRVSKADVDSGKAANGFTCNMRQIGHEGASGGFKVLRYVDKAGHECAYYDTTLLFPLNARNLGDHPTGVAVLDMSDPAHPVRTTTLVTPAMQSPHESLALNKRRGLLAAVLGSPAAYPGAVDVYDLTADCRHPALQSSLPVAFLGHESGFAPDGRTFYATSLFDGHVTAVDLTNPKLPAPLTVFNSLSHGMTISDDGNRAYAAARGVGLSVLDVSDIQWRRLNPQVHEVSHLAWDSLTIPQTAIPVTIHGRRMMVEIDEFSTNEEGSSFPAMNGSVVGAARILDIQDEKKPRVVSNIRLQVHQPANRSKVAGDPGASSFVQGYAGHYCAVPRERNPGIVACSFILSGLRVFDIRDPYNPKELAYFVAPPRASPGLNELSNYAMSAPAFAPKRREIWYSDGNSGFYALRVSKGVWPFGSANPCLRPAAMTFALHRIQGTRIVRAEAFVNGARRLVRTGDDLRRVVLEGLPRSGRMTIRIEATYANGARSIARQTFDGCARGEPRLRVIGAGGPGGSDDDDD